MVEYQMKQFQCFSESENVKGSVKELKCYRIMEPLFHKRLTMPEKCERICPWNRIHERNP